MIQGKRSVRARRSSVTIEEVRDYWDKNPLCASGIPHPIGSPDYFSFYDGLREANEPPEFSHELHEYPRFAGKRVLDVGCGNGYVLDRYAREGAEVFGVDITGTAVDLCRKRFALSGRKGDFRVADAEALPFEDGYFDCVCAIQAAHKKGCSYLRMALSKIGFPCDEHGLDECEDCTPCTCKEMP
jgi:2-polyprenyl-3-methyl-5-hydroxy-6-metoxy-1,4-benzoquinol methylase